MLRLPRISSSFFSRSTFFRFNSTFKMSELTHPTIQDGWFSEKSGMWPGQAMSLKVNQIIHHEKSKYQDVLVFESSDYGTVLVLDNVIQCTERDEFSYQEMITHLAMNSHPNPEKVLVIGGGDGGVLREVVKHASVKEATLCDIDEAVIRVSKKYLPGMAIGFQHPNAHTHVGDGFEFLKNRQNEFDVIITDSSDPEGPAESLFQKPYFELLKSALREGGVITTQGCSSIAFWPLTSVLPFPTTLLPLFVIQKDHLANPFRTTPQPTRLTGSVLRSSENQWLHLDLIADLKKSCKEVFPVAEYAYTTIPTYPSGQIGFMVCCKDASRNVREPLRTWSAEEEQKLCRYYNQDIHRASFVLPNFARQKLNA
ncbi:hypothetical protein N7522_013140 [Penicillium canescens]|uniref:PABS domain-containing protein n=2 Tax=Penicillium canescens TaxID=5083 RepID=A0AAD6N1L2_PENCN|nr:hypothetical protein N7522_013140 [Penicillium canescens]KAJ6022450.1 hypothetical protein N7460_012845 [Penicillium canescens]KAJ6026291.1 hypothetical protein N7444_013970 [Penicillium canescens]KAJ6158096.1 hypothetical protein N7485_010922 [Penicillium canescens]